MIKLEEQNKAWVLNTDLHALSVNERKDTIILLYFLNKYKDDIRAFKELKSAWVDSVYKLPETSSKGYNSTKNGRYNILSRMRRIHKEYMVELQPKNSK